MQKVWAFFFLSSLSHLKKKINFYCVQAPSVITLCACFVFIETTVVVYLEAF